MLELIRKRAAVLGTTCVSFALVLCAPKQGFAQVCWPCQSEFNHHEWGDIHWDNRGDVAWVHAPDGKHESWGTDPCSVAHQYEECGGGGGSEDDGDLLALLDPSSVEDAELVSAFLGAGNRVVLNRERRALQVLACGDSSIVLSHVPLDSRRVAILVSAIEQAELDR